MDFWELHRRLGECYEADLGAQHRASDGTLHCSSRDFGRESPICASDMKEPGFLEKRIAPPPPSGSPKMLLKEGSFDGVAASSASLPVPGSSSGGLRKKKSRSLKSPVGETRNVGSGGVASGSDGNEKIEKPLRKVSVSQTVPAMPPVTANSSLSSDDRSAMITYEPRTCWAQKSRLGRRGSTSINAINPLNGTASNTLHGADSEGRTVESMLKSQRGARSLQPLNPNGHLRNIWDFAGVMILGVDLVLIPLLFVQPRLYELFPSLAIESKMAVCYWLLDFALSFFTGYLEKGTLVMDLRKIACRYLSTWFVPDLTVNAIDVVMILAESMISNDESMRASTRLLRLLRLSRVVRLGKLTKFASFLRDKFESEVTYTQFSLVILILAMCLLEHIIACGWFGIGSMETESTWLSRSEWSDSSFTLQYTTALRWAFSQLGVGGTELEAVNEKEGIYSNVVALISLITFSSVVSSMTSLVSTLQGQGREETQQFSLLRRFLRVNHIPENLSHRITRFLHYTYHERTANVDDPQILMFLSKSLHAELQLERHREHIDKIQFLHTLLHNPSISFQEGQVMQTLAQRALSSHDLGEDDVVFCHGNPATSAYLLLHGSMTYRQVDMNVQPTGDYWICEMCLWTHWSHFGDLHCQSFSHICALHVQEFCEVICSSPTVQVQAHNYAKDYINCMHAENACSDLWVSELQVAKNSSLRGDDWMRSKWTSWVKGPASPSSHQASPRLMSQVVPQ